MDNRGTAPFSSIEASYRKAPPVLQGATGQEGQTATKRGEQSEFHSQVTPRPQRKILLFGEDKSRHLFPLVRDREIGIEGRYQNVVIESSNDDDRRTTSTQLQRGMIQTLEDLYEVLGRKDSKSSSYYTQNS